MFINIHSQCCCITNWVPNTDYFCIAEARGKPTTKFQTNGRWLCPVSVCASVLASSSLLIVYRNTCVYNMYRTYDYIRHTHSNQLLVIEISTWPNCSGPHIDHYYNKYVWIDGAGIAPYACAAKQLNVCMRIAHNIYIRKIASQHIFVLDRCFVGCAQVKQYQRKWFSSKQRA